MKLHTYSKQLIQLEAKDYSYLEELFIQWRKEKEKEKKLKLDKDLKEILKYFINHRIDASPYQCHKYLKKENLSSMAPNNVRINAQKLCEYNLLKEAKISFEDKDKDIQKTNKHNARYYKISSFGMFYLLKEEFKNNPFDFNPDIILKYGNTKLYDFILFKFITLETIEQIKSKFIFNKILLYLNRICIMIENLFNFITNQSLLLESIEKMGGLLLTDSFIFDYLFTKDMKRNQVFLSHFKLSQNKYSYRYSSEILTIEDKQRIIKYTITENKKEIFLKINRTKMKLEFYRNFQDIESNKIFFELDINSKFNFGDDDENELRKNYLPLNIENLIKLYFDPYYKFEMQNHLNELCLRILAFNIQNSNIQSNNENYLDPYIHHDLILLNKDKNFKLTVNSLEKYTLDLYKDFRNL